MINEFNEILSGLGISKVKLAKYLGVSRQMLYNYLAMDSLEEWPEEKAAKIKELLGIKKDEDLKDIKISTKYINIVESKINEEAEDSKEKDNFEELRGYNRRQQEKVLEIFESLKNLLTVDENEKIEAILSYLNDFIKSMEENEELKYILAYYAKYYQAVNPKDFVFDKKEQLIMEAIMYLGMTMYSNKDSDNNKLSKAKIEETHEQFEKEIKMLNEERLSRTEELNTAKIKALEELGYDEITFENAKEVLDKIAEIQARH